MFSFSLLMVDCPLFALIQPYLPTPGTVPETKKAYNSPGAGAGPWVVGGFSAPTSRLLSPRSWGTRTPRPGGRRLSDVLVPRSGLLMDPYGCPCGRAKPNHFLVANLTCECPFGSGDVSRGSVGSAVAEKQLDRTSWVLPWFQPKSSPRCPVAPFFWGGKGSRSTQ